MKKYILTLVALVSFSSVAFADTYEGSVAGIHCPNCKKTIVDSFSAIEGVKSVTIQDVEGEELHHLLVVTGNGAAEISKAKAIETLKEATEFTIKTWARKQS